MNERDKVLEEVAVMCEESELLFSLDIWMNCTKQEISARTARALADRIRQLESVPVAPDEGDFANYSRGQLLDYIDVLRTAQGERQPCFHTNTVTQRTGDGTPVEFCRDCGTNRA